ncbi:hypothetical protein NKG05_00860 [Oerskovia sp. M15]
MPTSLVGRDDLEGDELSRETAAKPTTRSAARATRTANPGPGGAETAPAHCSCIRGRRARRGRRRRAPRRARRATTRPGSR